MDKIFLTVVFLLFFPVLVLGQQKQQNAFVDPTTGILKTVGYTDTNAPGDIKIPVPANFNLQPGQWKWNGSTWVAAAPGVDQSSFDLTNLAIAIDNAVSSSKVPAEIKDVLLKLKKVLGL